MTLKELQSGVKFKYAHGSHYTLERVSTGAWVICQFGNYLASVEKMTAKYIYAYTYIMDQKVELKINIEQCVDMKKEEVAA